MYTVNSNNSFMKDNWINVSLRHQNNQCFTEDSRIIGTCFIDSKLTSKTFMSCDLHHESCNILHVCEYFIQGVHH